ncbi:envelope-like protein [Cucumis melo var. makuwa]|uniref:Envelope-like protein n=1 Tax=Cucumis melo var. makuwa TaxID=1194695 RepID=A0A5D3BEJ9_CUCMM|nr:envelope-like protein [Cucumis melo var. makuwa]TYJ97469.1 envelope-like protein [Cucumis melo var. makuwa]
MNNSRFILATKDTPYEIKQRKEGIFITQEKYAKNIVKNFSLVKSQQKRTLAATHVKITKDSNGDSIDHKLYRSMIGSLLYLTASRLDIAYVVEESIKLVHPESSVFVHDENVASVFVENVESEPIFSGSHMSEMDSDKRADVPLARILVRSSSHVDFQPSVPDPNLVGQTIDNVGENIADNVVQRHIADEMNVSDNHHSYLSVMDLIVKVGLSKTISNVGSKFKISPALINGLLGNTWNLALLIHIHPTMFWLGYYLEEGLFFIQICNDDSLDVGLFIYNQLLKHVETFGVKISIPLPRFLSSLLVHLNVDILPTNDVSSPDPKTSLSYRFFVHRDLASRIINTLIVEARALSTSINLLFDRRLEVDSLVRRLKTLIPSSSNNGLDHE